MESRYFVETPDGQRYGPADLATLKEWVTQGRVTAETTLVSEAGGERTRAELHKELFGVDPALPPVVAVPRVTATPPFAPSMTPGSIPQAVPRKNHSTLIILGVLGAMGLCGVSIFAAILFPVFEQAKAASKRTQGLSGMKQVGVGLLIYQADADDHFPIDMTSARTFRPAVEPYVKNPALFRSLNPAGGEILSDARLSGRNAVNVVDPSASIVLYDSLPWPQGTVPIGRVDGSAKILRYPVLAGLLAPDPFGGLTRQEERRRERASRR